MVTLTAIIPDRFGIIDHDCVGRHHCRACFDRHKAREEAVSAWHIVLDGLARLVEGGLHYAMVL